jgi:glutaconate CoA-transferase subunit A
MRESKLMTLTEAVTRFVPDGASVAMGLAQEIMIPFAVGHEIVRQKIRRLTLIGPISDILFDQLIGAGCVDKICAAWVGNVITGSSYNFRRAVEGGAIEMVDHSNLTLATGLKAGAMGIPFMPTRSALGSSIFETNPGLKHVNCPFTGDLLAAVAAITPDVAVVHVQRADMFGSAHFWGNLGITREACLASRHIILSAEQIVPPEQINSDPNRVFTPGFRVSAVVEAPWGAHPSPAPGYYNRDHQAFLDYQAASRTAAEFEDWQSHWIDSIHGSSQYLAQLGEQRVDSLRLRRDAFTEAANYGY